MPPRPQPARTSSTPQQAPQPPRSAAHFVLNLAALAGGLATMWAWWQMHPGDTLHTALWSCVAVAAIIGGAELLWLRVDRRSSTGLAPQSLRAVSPARVAVRLLGLGATVGLIALAYWLFPEYHFGFYGSGANFYAPCRRLLGVIWPALIAVPVYFAWADRRIAEPRDGYWQLGALLCRQQSLAQADWPLLRAHLMGWVVKAFFLPLMVVYLDGEVRALANAGSGLPATWHALGQVLANLPGSLHPLPRLDLLPYQFLYELSYTVDLLFCVVGYSLTLRLFDSHIRSTEPTLFGWLVALLCYQPFYSVIGNNYLAYDDNLYWGELVAPWPLLRYFWAAAIIALLFIYALSTVAFGLRFSNLTHRGIITGGPYRFTKHPAYIAKNLSWWLISVPFVSHLSAWEALRNSCLLGLLNLIYFLRARTEERHLSRDPQYVAYALWIDQHGLFRRFGRLLPFLRYRAPAGTAAASA